MKVATLEELHAINAKVLVYLHRLTPNEVRALIQQKEEYYGFHFAVLPEPFHTELLISFGFTPREIQCEIVWMEGERSGQIHEHRYATAAIVILGESEHLPNPVNAETYLRDTWFPAVAGYALDVQNGTDHAFRVRAGGVVFFLTSQSPPIEGPDGNHDYHPKQ